MDGLINALWKNKSEITAIYIQLKARVQNERSLKMKHNTGGGFQQQINLLGRQEYREERSHGVTGYQISQRLNS